MTGVSNTPETIALLSYCNVRYSRFVLKRIAIIGVLAFLLFVAAVGLYFIRASRASSVNYNTTLILKQVQTLSQLVTVKYVVESVIVAEDSKWYGDSRVLLVAHGIVKAGINLESLKPGDIRINGKKLTMKLPGAGLTDVYIDDHRTQVLERTTGLMRAFDKDLEQNARKDALQKLSRAAYDNGIIKDADERARTMLGALFYQLGFEEVTFL
ncbi:MAG: hypothetical protein JWO95_974 [Verrucomicrobiales bacterium]|nr:hypothetical protein [Verrucomicrobiales bacterium]